MADTTLTPNQRARLEAAVFGGFNGDSPRDAEAIVQGVEELRRRYDAMRDATHAVSAAACRWVD